MKSRFRIRLRYQTVAYRLRRADPRTWLRNIRALRWSRQVHVAHLAATLHPYRGPSSDTLPAVEVAGVLVFVYLDKHHKALRVSVDLDTVAPWLLNKAECVPMLITVNGHQVFSADYPERSA